MLDLSLFRAKIIDLAARRLPLGVAFQTPLACLEKFPAPGVVLVGMGAFAAIQIHDAACPARCVSSHPR
jgi:hypothetical protein